MSTTVLLVDDVEEVRAVVRQALGLRGGFTVVADEGDGTAAIAAANEYQPDIVVLDLGLPDLAGQEVLTRLHEAAPAAQVVIYTGTTAEDTSSGQRHVAAFVRKDRDVREVVDLVANVSRHMYGANLEVGPDLGDIALARRFLSRHCLEWGCEAVADDAVLVGTELVTNALLHASTECVLRARLAGGVLHIEVQDSGGGTPDVKAADERAEHGRGLLIVSALCFAWGVDSRPSAGKRVWAQLVVSRADDSNRRELANAPR